MLLPCPHYRTGLAVDQKILSATLAPAVVTLPRHYTFHMARFGYIAMLLFTVVGSFWLEIVLKVRVLARIRRVLAATLPISALFIAWDIYAVHRHHWFFDPAQVIGLYGPFHIPIEEYLFFLIVPLAAIMTIEAVRTVKRSWPV